jgi:putative ABC transport system permease protein
VNLLTLSQLRFLRFAPWSTLAVLFGMTLGVASIVAVHQIGAAVVASLEDVVPPHLRYVSHVVEREDASMDDYFRLRARWRAGELVEVSRMMPIVDGSVVVGDRVWRVVGIDAFSGVPELLGLSALPVNRVVVGAGQGLDPDAAVAARDGLTITVGLVHQAVPEGVWLTDVGTAQQILSLPDTAITSIAVVVTGPFERLGAWIEALMPGFSAGVTLPGWSLDGWTVRSLEDEVPSLAFARSVLFNLGALGTLALVVSWLLVYQVGVIWLRRQQRTFERLRQMGVTGMELARTFVAGLAATGLVAGAAGLWLGSVLAGLLAQAATGYADEGPAYLPGLDGWVAGKAMVSAVAVSALGGCVAWFREQRSAGARVGTGLAVMLLAGLAVIGIWGSDGLLAGFGSIAAIALAVLWAIGPILGRLRASAGRLGGNLLMRVGFRDLLWYPRDLAVAVGAMALALATSIAVSLMVDSFRLDFERMLDRRMVHDLYVVGSGRDLSPLAAMLTAREDVEAVQAYGRSGLTISGIPIELGYTTFDARESARYGLENILTDGEAVVSERLARILDLSIGDALPIAAAPLRVAGVFAGFGDAQARVLVDDRTAAALGLVVLHDRLSIRTDAVDAVTAALIAADRNLSVTEQATLKQSALDIFDRTFAITHALTLMAILVAGVGLYNALTALEILVQRTRVLLTAMGVSRGELTAMRCWRVVAVGCCAAGFAVPLGVVMGWLLCEVINPRAFGWSLNLTVDWQAFGPPLLAAGAAMALVAVLPAPRERTLDEG